MIWQVRLAPGKGDQPPVAFGDAPRDICAKMKLGAEGGRRFVLDVLSQTDIGKAARGGDVGHHAMVAKWQRLIGVATDLLIVLGNILRLWLAGV